MKTARFTVVRLVLLSLVLVVCGPRFVDAQEGPTITTPQSLIIAPGSNATFNVLVSSPAWELHQWYFNGAPLTNGGRITIFEQSISAGTNKSTLTIVSVQESDAGSYWVVATNDTGTTTGGFGTLTVGTIPMITQQPATIQSIEIGDSVTLTVGATGTAPLSYQWYHGTSQLTDNGRIVGAQTPVLTITNSSVTDNGGYTVVISNALGMATSAVGALNVGTMPIITQQPTTMQNVASGNPVTFTVTATGSAPLGYQWYHGASQLTDDGRIVGAQTSALTITNSLDTDSGGYSVVVSNVLGSATSKVGMLAVGTVPTITEQPPTRQTVTNPTPVTITISATGSEPLSYQWYHWRYPLTNDGRIVGAQTSALTFTNSLINDSGNYTVTVSNVFGSVTSSNSYLTVFTLPTSGPLVERSVPLGLPTVFKANASAALLYQ